VKKRLYLMDGPDGKPLSFFPTDVIMVGSVNLPGKPTGLKDKEGNEVPAKPEYRPDVSAIMTERMQQPLVVKGEVPDVTREINERLKWAEGDDSGPGKVLKMVPPPEKEAE
jgi:hypothetical protein